MSRPLHRHTHTHTHKQHANIQTGPNNNNNNKYHKQLRRWCQQTVSFSLSLFYWMIIIWLKHSAALLCSALLCPSLSHNLTTHKQAAAAAAAAAVQDEGFDSLFIKLWFQIWVVAFLLFFYDFVVIVAAAPCTCWLALAQWLSSR